MLCRKPNGHSFPLIQKTNENKHILIRGIRSLPAKLDPPVKPSRTNDIQLIPGVVRHLSTGPISKLAVKDPKTWPLQTKERVSVASTGLSLSACESILEFLKVMYDLVETHEQVLRRGVLHRDISWYSVLCKPQHFTGNAVVIDHPTIGKILEEGDTEPRCLLTGFDNACFTEEKKSSCIAERTGTPMFMACELMYGRKGYEMLRRRHVPPISLNQFALEGDIFKAYIRVYGKERYDAYDKCLQSVISGTAEEVHPFFADDLMASHLPHHDMESVYWIILWFFVKAWPKGIKLDGLDLGKSGPNSHNFIRKTMLARGTAADDAFPIVNWLGNSEKLWELLLHPVFKHLAGMLADMGQYICMCWSRFPDVPFWHSHEAFKRLLLKEIIRMVHHDESIPIQGLRPPLEHPF